MNRYEEQMIDMASELSAEVVCGMADGIADIHWELMPQVDIFSYGAIGLAFNFYNRISDDEAWIFFDKAADHITVNDLNVTRKGLLLTTPEYRRIRPGVVNILRNIHSVFELQCAPIELNNKRIDLLRCLMGQKSIEIDGHDEEWEIVYFAHSIREIVKLINELARKEHCVPKVRPGTEVIFAALLIRVFQEAKKRLD